MPVLKKTFLGLSMKINIRVNCIRKQGKRTSGRKDSMCDCSRRQSMRHLRSQE